ncbi:hypothetical protein VNO77_34422 [Canavalia gladiata]|uniref:Uncharacterized protein n=1 Tax=Canavalia gladiata TaxID=3824 RepID=A0AAN9KFI5_CANGL
MSFNRHPLEKERKGLLARTLRGSLWHLTLVLATGEGATKERELDLQEERLLSLGEVDKQEERVLSLKEVDKQEEREKRLTAVGWWEDLGFFPTTPLRSHWVEEKKDKKDQLHTGSQAFNSDTRMHLIGWVLEQTTQSPKP